MVDFHILSLLRYFQKKVIKGTIAVISYDLPFPIHDCTLAFSGQVLQRYPCFSFLTNLYLELFFLYKSDCAFMLQKQRFKGYSCESGMPLTLGSSEMNMIVPITEPWYGSQAES